MPALSEMLVTKDNSVGMRDGCHLSTDIYRPNDSQPHPCLLQRVPYDKSLPGMINGAVDVGRAVRRGFVVVIQDCRGWYASEGVFEPFVNEAIDGEDSILWMAQQPWCNGDI